MYNKDKKFYELYAAFAPEPSKFSLAPKPSNIDLTSTRGQVSHSSSHNDSYKFISPYIQKPKPLHVYNLDLNSENLHNEDPTSIAFNLIPHFPITSRKTRYYYELIF